MDDGARIYAARKRGGSPMLLCADEHDPGLRDCGPQQTHLQREVQWHRGGMPAHQPYALPVAQRIEAFANVAVSEPVVA